MTDWTLQDIAREVFIVGAVLLYINAAIGIRILAEIRSARDRILEEIRKKEK